MRPLPFGEDRHRFAAAEHLEDRMQAVFAEVAVDGEGAVLADEGPEKRDLEQVVPGQKRQRSARDQPDEERVDERLMIRDDERRASVGQVPAPGAAVAPAEVEDPKADLVRGEPEEVATGAGQRHDGPYFGLRFSSSCITTRSAAPSVPTAYWR